jgi:hypothetical protein
LRHREGRLKKMVRGRRYVRVLEAFTSVAGSMVVLFRPDDVNGDLAS